MTSALIIILREVLEAMLIVCILMAAADKVDVSKRWVGLAILIGAGGAGIYAFAFDAITNAFDGVGQEVTNAAMLFAIYIFLTLYNFFVISHLRPSTAPLPVELGIFALLASIGFAITREGAEIYIYLSGYLLSPEPLLPVILGGILGGGIGLSAGALIYYGLVTLNWKPSLWLCCFILVPVSAGMVSQGTNYLIQADIVPSQLPLWDTSSFIPEGSVLGELFYALFSYEASPTPIQTVLYLLCLAAVIAGMLVMSGKFTARGSQS